jgi:hypothetical protein
MANRNQSDGREHETLPGPGPGLKSSRGAVNVRPVEQMVDAAIERFASENLARERAAFGPAQDGEHEPVHELDLALYETPPSRPRKPTRLRWKGLDVSDEFRSYAERVARGEDLPPFEGRVLAEPNPAFPWNELTAAEPPKPAGRGSRLVLWGSAAVVLALLGWSIVERLERPATATLEDAPSVSTSSLAASPPATPHDVVSADVVGPDVVHGDVVTSTTLNREPEARVEATAPATVTSAVAPPSAESAPPAASGAASALAPPPSSTSASVAAPVASSVPAAPTAKLAPPGALEQAIGAVFAARAASTSSPAPTGVKGRDDDFGIIPSVDSAPVVSTTTTSTAIAAKSALPVAGNVGDLARANQPSSGAVRKEPGTESSAKGSLLVEVPSF